MKRKLSKVAIGLVALAVQLLPVQAWAVKCCIELPGGVKLCADCSDDTSCDFELLDNGNYRIVCT